MMLELQRWLYGEAATQLKALAGGTKPLTLLGGICFAALFGLVHAIMPGHGKTVLVSYFLGRPATVTSGLATSIILVFTHVGSAVLLVLAGFILIQKTIGGAGRAPAFETTSAVFIMLIGIWFLYNAVWHQHHSGDTPNGPVLAFAAGLVPCPLTTFIMVYAVSNGAIAAGLVLSASMALGMITTIGVFAVTAVLLRERLFHLMHLTARARGRLGQALEVIGAVAIIGPLASFEPLKFEWRVTS
jgi:ABC-type nickel/cobalt efflux system permease component RcnA